MQKRLFLLWPKRFAQLPEVQKKILAMFYYEAMKLPGIVRCRRSQPRRRAKGTLSNGNGSAIQGYGIGLRRHPLVQDRLDTRKATSLFHGPSPPVSAKELSLLGSFAAVGILGRFGRPQHREGQNQLALEKPGSIRYPPLGAQGVSLTFGANREWLPFSYSTTPLQRKRPFLV